MSLRHGIMGLLNYTGSTGYELKKIFDESLNFFWQASKSQIYKELSTLEKAGFLSVELVVQEDKPNKKVYSLTDSGKKEFLDWLNRDLDPDDFSNRDAFLMKVFFWGEIGPEEAIAKLQAYIKIHQGKLERYRTVPDHVDNYARLAGHDRAQYWIFTVRHGSAYSQTCIDWAREAIGFLEKE